MLQTLGSSHFCHQAASQRAVVGGRQGREMVGGKSLIENTTKNQSSHFSIIYQPPFLLHIPTLLLFSHTAPSSTPSPKETGNTIPSMYLHILCISFGFKRSSPTRPSSPKVKFTELLWGLTILMGGKWTELIRPKNN